MLNEMNIPSHTLRTFKKFGDALIEEFKTNSEMYGFFNGGDHSTIFVIERVGDTYMLFHIDGTYSLTKAAFLSFVRRAIKASVPVRLNI